ncbi:MAG: ribosomal protein S18-alanine N-acetyltransferase [Clostridia bacterium]|nr:ribosomal protein S18-alanine N-acetyltransferase [Clostridia bacterium]
MIVEQMAERHIAAIAAIEQDCFHDPWTENGLREELELENNLFLAAVEEDAVVGYVGCQTVLDEGYITNVAVSPAHRRKGVAARLLTELRIKAEEKGLSFVTLEMRASNEPAIALYRGAGYVEVGVRRNFYTNPKEDALLMTCFLKETE